MIRTNIRTIKYLNIFKYPNICHDHDHAVLVTSEILISHYWKSNVNTWKVNMQLRKPKVREPADLRQKSVYKHSLLCKHQIDRYTWFQKLHNLDNFLQTFCLCERDIMMVVVLNNFMQ